jgi:predicted branched-subunit amino acid permease
MLPTEYRFSSDRDAFRGGLHDAVGAPALVLGASYIGFGALARSAGLDLAPALASTLSGWALPGQVALVEMMAIGAGLIAIAIAVTLANVRLLPMVAVFVPMLRRTGLPQWVLYPAAHLVAITGWVQGMRVSPLLPAAQRLPYFVGFAGTLWITSLGCTAIGFFLVNRVPLSLSLGFVFMNPLYFLLVLTADLKVRGRILAMAMGAVLGPLLHLWSPGWGLLATGLLAGTGAFALDRVLVRRHV